MSLAPAPMVEIAPGMHALAGGILYIEATQSVVAADIHFAYEEVIGGALPLWSIGESLQHLRTAVRASGAREIILLGDVVHGAFMSAGAAQKVITTLEDLRDGCTLTIIAGNHEGLSRAADILGDTHEAIERAGWLLVHGDDIITGHKCIIGHLHPSIHFAGRSSAPAFLASASLVVVPALTPYSIGLNVCSRAAEAALRPWLGTGEELTVFGVAGTCVYPFGTLAALKEAKKAKPSYWPRKRKNLRRS